MFSGIIQAASPIVSAEMKHGCRRVRIKTPHGWKLAHGQSIAVDGVCSTIVAHAPARAHAGRPATFDVEYMPETLSKTTAGLFQKNTLVNLERSLTLGSLVDGHLVQGHVDARGRIAGVVEVGASKEVIIAAPQSLMRYIALHGSIAVNGVSLTVARTGRSTFTVALIPHTLTHTNLGLWGVGDLVNIEVDMIARYLFGALERGRVRRDAKKRTHKKG